MSTETTKTAGGNGQERPVAATQRTTSPPPKPPRALSSLHHGGHVISDVAFSATTDAVPRADVSASSQVLGASSTVQPAGNPFDYLLPELAVQWPDSHLPVHDPDTVVTALKALGSAMIEDSDDSSPTPSAIPPIPPIYTYWGQFIDHDLTANTDRDDSGLSITTDPLEPRTPAFVAANLHNLRQPALNLDSVYGDGPGAPDATVPYVGKTLKLGSCSPLNGTTPPTLRVPGIAGGPGARLGAADERDLPRDPATKQAQIGDARNDENLIVAQLHVAFLHVHNRVLSLLAPGDPDPAVHVFEEARRIVRWTYQWLVRNDFLVRLVPAEAITAVESRPRLVPRERGVFMPLEFSVAAFRFGHSMVRGNYDWNLNFGRPDPGETPSVVERSSFDLLFQFTGGGGFNPDFPTPTLPDNWPAQWKRLTQEADDPESFPDRFARPIDTNLALPLDAMIKEGEAPSSPLFVRQILKRLAVRNLLRGYKLAIPTGQAVARAYGLVPLSAAELHDTSGRAVRHALLDGKLLDATPLWFYVLKEAELRGGHQLGPVGGRIVADTLIGQLRQDPESYLAMEAGWDPRSAGAQGGKPTLVDLGGPPIGSIKELLQFAGLL